MSGVYLNEEDCVAMSPAGGGNGVDLLLQRHLLIKLQTGNYLSTSITT